MSSLYPLFAYARSPLLGLPHHALVIGNSRYPDSQLDNPTTDARAIAGELKASGFDVNLLLDTGRDTLLNALEAYARKLAQLRLDQLLANAGERKIDIASRGQNPFSKGTLRIDTRVKIGDRYTYREANADNNEEIRKCTVAVSQITETDVIYGKGGLVTALIGNWIKINDRTLTGAQYFIPDYSLGKRWTSRHRSTSAKGNHYDTVADCKVAARESRTQPVGTFDAFRIECSGWACGESGFNIELKSRCWVAPGLRRCFEGFFWQRTTRGTVPENKSVQLLELKQSSVGLRCRETTPGARYLPFLQCALPRESHLVASATMHKCAAAGRGNSPSPVRARHVRSSTDPTETRVRWR